MCRDLRTGFVSEHLGLMPVCDEPPVLAPARERRAAWPHARSTRVATRRSPGAVVRCRMRKTLAVLGLVVSCATLSLVLDRDSAQAKSSEALALSLSKIMLTDEMYSQMLEQMGAGIAQSAGSAGGKLPPDFAEKMGRVVREALPRNDLLQFNAEVYAKRFSDAELQQIIAFYQTPTGSKILREMPSVMREVMLKVGGLLPQRLPALMKKHGLMPPANP